MAEKVTEMLLKVHDLECSKCYKKVKKILCKFPHVYVFGVFVNKTKEIQDQVYDEKNNTVRIKVVCCSPEKIRDKICCKGRGIIKCIVIVIPEVKKPPPPEEKKPPPPPPEEKKPPPPEEKKPPPPPPEVKKPPPPEVKIKDKNTIVVNIFDVPKPCYCGRNCDGYCARPVYCSCGCGGYRGNCGRPVCSCGCGGYRGNCGRPVCSCGCGGYGGNCVRPVHCSCGCGGYRVNCVRLVYCSCGCGGYRGNCGSRCSEYYCNEDNSQGCTIM
ncbi:hypothetical protein EZV62_002492 [Acer yangbiense]|uniref:HMA domain-containing protein n=1 Tax=Acer yangbiense TaxID=1000413 RepID=A0A5C7IXK2_9ROSI|nr:hypothetical protein EZV62_002492 [Acer yangbiense]